jgi:predicted nucleic acid-binding protein
MSLIVLLDTGPLGLVINPRGGPDAEQCNVWMMSLLSTGAQVIVPEIADYEVRRELLRANKTPGVQRLDELKTTIDYLPLTTETMLKAAEFWAETRQKGRPTADDKALDGDVILAAQAALMPDNGDDVIVATTNVRHLERFVTAREWQAIG